MRDVGDNEPALKLQFGSAGEDLMADKMKIVVLVGSLRKESYNRKAAEALIRIAPPSLELQLIEIGHLPLYNQDLDDESRPPSEWVKFRNKIRPMDGVLFVTPEYNRSIPGVLKNALDIGSRPYGKSVWTGKPGAVMSVSPGSIGGFGGNHHLRQCLVFLDVPTMQQPEAYIGGAASLTDFLKAFVESYARWVSSFANMKQVAA